MSSNSHLSPLLRALEAESIHILREAAAAEVPVLLYSIGKDSAALLHLATRAFHPASIPFPVLHIDTLWKFRDMIAFRDATARRLGIDLRVYSNPEGKGMSPFRDGSAPFTDVMKTRALRQALDINGFRTAIGGARRDEERSRAKERIFSIRAPGHRWEPRSQRPEFWTHYNTQLGWGETQRVFPLSNWTEVDVWEYIAAENIPVVPLYFAKKRPVVERDGMLIVRDDDRMDLKPGERVQMESVRFRTLGCWPLTGAVRSSAASVAEIIVELKSSSLSERQGRRIDHDQPGAMERKKRDGYF